MILRRNNPLHSTLQRLALSTACLLAFSCSGTAQTQSQPSNPQASPQQQQPPAQSQDSTLPDAPAVQPNTEPAAPVVNRPETAPTKKPVQRDPWTNQPIVPPSDQAPGDDSATEGTTPPPPMPPVKTVPPGTTTKPGSNSQDQLVTLIRVHANFVQVPVTVKDHSGHPVEDLRSTDFTVKENGVVQKLSFFSSDPFALSVAIVLDLGMPDTAVQQINQTFPALVGAFAPYDEVSFYTYSSTVSQVSDFTAANRHLAARLEQMKSERGSDNGPPVLSGPLAQNGPIINGVPVGSATAPVNTPVKEAHVLNDAILQAALDLSKRGPLRRKIIFVISDGRESGSKASYRDVLRLLQSRQIEVRAVGVEGAALPIIRKLEQLHIPDQGRSDILPKYVKATTGGTVYSELSRKAIEDVYSEAMMEARNQYTLGYTPIAPKVPTKTPYHSIEVIVHRPGLKVSAKDGYYPVLAQ